MDISERYIKMCEKAVEVQKAWKPQDWDFVWVLDRDGNGYSWVILPRGIADSGVYGPYVEDGKIQDERYQGNLIWLPRQDQLQEMLKEKYQDWLLEYPPIKHDERDHTFEEILVHKFDMFVSYKCEHSHDASMEQLWLAFVMDERKIW